MNNLAFYMAKLKRDDRVIYQFQVDAKDKFVEWMMICFRFMHACNMYNKPKRKIQCIFSDFLTLQCKTFYHENVTENWRPIL